MEETVIPVLLRTSSVLQPAVGRLQYGFRQCRSRSTGVAVLASG